MIDSKVCNNRNRKQESSGRIAVNVDCFFFSTIVEQLSDCVVCVAYHIYISVPHLFLHGNLFARDEDIRQPAIKSYGRIKKS